MNNFYEGLERFGEHQTSWKGLLQKNSSINQFACYFKADYTPAAILDTILNN